MNITSRNGLTAWKKYFILMTYGLPHLAYGSCAYMATKTDRPSMMKSAAFKELKKITWDLIYKTFNLPKRGKKEPVTELFFRMKPENMIFRNYLRNVTIWTHKCLMTNDNN